MKKLITLLLLLCFLISPVPAWYIKPMLGRQINWSDPLSKGLVAYWLMNEGTGSKVNDLSGNGNTGTLIADTSWANGKFGPVLSFDGTGDYVDCGTNFNFSNNNELTVLVWVSNVGERVFYASLIGKGLYVTAGDEFNISWGDHAGDRVRFSCAGAQFFTQNSLLTVGESACLALSYKKGSWGNCYKNGVLLGSLSAYSANIPVSAHPLTIGINEDFGEPYLGNIDCAFVFNRALSTSEIALLYREPHRLIARRPIGLTYIPVVTPSGQLIIINRN